jgi:integrase
MAKRMNGEGMIRQRKDGRFELRILVGHQENGKQKVISFYGKTLDEVREKKKAYDEDVAQGLNVKAKYTFGEFADMWFERHREEIEETTIEHYTYILRKLKEHFDNRGLGDITTPDIEDFLYRLRRQNYSDSYVRSCRGMLTQIYKRAQAYQLVRYNPAMLAAKMKSKTPQKKKESFTARECSRLFAELPQDRMGWTIRLMIATGMRPQEMMALEPRHIADDGAYVLVDQAVKRIKGTVEIGDTKNISSFRVIPVPETVRPSAIALRQTTKKFIWEAGKRGMPCNPSYFADKFKESLATIEGMPILTPHCCRVTYVSIMQSLGVKLETISHLVGHTTTRITESRYLRVQDEVYQNALERFDARFGGVRYFGDKSSIQIQSAFPEEM